MSDSIFRKLIRPMDARGMRGIMSRGRNVYPGGGNTGNTKKLRAFQEAALERMKKNAPNKLR